MGIESLMLTNSFDHRHQGNEAFAFGDLAAHALPVPAHTPAFMAYQVGSRRLDLPQQILPSVQISARLDAQLRTDTGNWSR